MMPCVVRCADEAVILLLQDLIEGRSTSILAWLVDIRDVVGAHVAAIEVE